MEQQERRRLLLEAKLRTLVRARWGDAAGGGVHAFPGGAALGGAEGVPLFVLAELNPARSLGGALALARRTGAGDVHLLASAAAGLLARRAGEFASPPSVWSISGTDLEPAAPEPLPPERRVDPRALDFAGAISRAGADPVVEHGVLMAEVRGLEVGRVVVDDDGARLEVGVGKHDREAQNRLRGGRPVEQVLTEAVRAVSERRDADAPPHQVNQVARERWLRRIVIERPEVVGARFLDAVDTAMPRDDLRLPAPAPAVGEDAEGRPVVVVCSVGIDLDFVPAAADLRLAHRPGARLVLVVPEGDDHPVTRDLAARLRDPADVVTVGRDWHRL